MSQSHKFTFLNINQSLHSDETYEKLMEIEIHDIFLMIVIVICDWNINLFLAFLQFILLLLPLSIFLLLSLSLSLSSPYLCVNLSAWWWDWMDSVDDDLTDKLD